MEIKDNIIITTSRGKARNALIKLYTLAHVAEQIKLGGDLPELLRDEIEVLREYLGFEESEVKP